MWCSLGLALDEIFEPYVPPQAAGSGGAVAADASGYLANYYNPAGLAKGFRKKWEVVLFDAESVLGLGGISALTSAQGVGTYKALTHLTAGKYTYYSLASAPAISTRDFAFSILDQHRFAALSDGTNVDVNSVSDIGPTIGIASNFLGNTLKIGLAVKLIDRNELKGNFALSQFNSEAAMDALSKEGMAVGGDFGVMYTYPSKWLPTVGVVWHDVMNTRFLASSTFQNSSANGLPSDIPQSFSAALSVRPALSRLLKTAFALQYDHAERTDIGLLKHFHFGIQFDNERSIYFWLGMSGLHPSAGFALRLPGGNLELATYGAEIGAGTTVAEDRRLIIRYTIGF